MEARKRATDHRLSGLCTVAEAASMLGVSPSTIWRWVDAGKLPAFRVGPKAIRIRRQDVEAAVRPRDVDVMPGAATRIHTDIKDALRPMTPEEKARALAWLDHADKLRAEIRAQRKGVPLPDSVEVIREAREERSRRL
jgi:excisionase family DNA binding protein